MDTLSILGHGAALIVAVLGVWGITHDFRTLGGRLTRPGVVAVTGLLLAALVSLATGIVGDMRNAAQQAAAAREAAERDAALAAANAALADLRISLADSEARERTLQREVTDMRAAQQVLLRRNADFRLTVDVHYHDLGRETERYRSALADGGPAPFLDWLSTEQRRYADTGGAASELSDLCATDSRDNCGRGEEGLIRFSFTSRIIEAALARFGPGNIYGTPTVFVIDVTPALDEAALVCGKGFDLIAEDLGPNTAASAPIRCPDDPPFVYVYDHLLGFDALDWDGRDLADGAKRRMQLGAPDTGGTGMSVGFNVDLALDGLGRLADLAGRRLAVVVMGDLFLKDKNLFPDTLYTLSMWPAGIGGRRDVSVTLQAGAERADFPVTVRHAFGQDGTSSTMWSDWRDRSWEGWRFRAYETGDLSMLVVDVPADPAHVTAVFDR